MEDLANPGHHLVTHGYESYLTLGVCLVHVCSREQQYGHTLGWCCLSCFTGGGLGAAGATTIATSLDGYSYLTHLDVAGTLLEQMGLHIRIVSCVLFLVSTTVGGVSGFP